MLHIIESILWALALILIVYTGLLTTLKFQFVQLKFKDMIKNLFEPIKGNISSFESLMIVLGGRIGVGSIAGISLAIYLGGVGTVFWIWVIGILSAAISFAETVLGIKYQVKANHAYGGPSYYLQNGLKLKKLSKIYAWIIIISYIGGFLSIQSNTITTAITNYVNISPLPIGILLGVISLIIIIGGIDNIKSVSKYLVPIMMIIYLCCSFYIIILNSSKIPELVLEIFNSAFNIKSMGSGVLSSMIIGIQRGIFSSEAGLGTGAIASSIAETDYPAKCGFVQIIGIYITTFLICTSTAMIISLSDYNIEVINGIELTQSVFTNYLGNFGNIIIIISIILFAFSTILSGYYDGESSLKFLFPNINKLGMMTLKFITFFVIIIGSIARANLLWKIVNILTALLAIINVYAIIKLKDDVIFELKKYYSCFKR